MLRSTALSILFLATALAGQLPPPPLPIVHPSPFTITPATDDRVRAGDTIELILNWDARLGEQHVHVPPLLDRNSSTEQEFFAHWRAMGQPEFQSASQPPLTIKVKIPDYANGPIPLWLDYLVKNADDSYTKQRTEHTLLVFANPRVRPVSIYVQEHDDLSAAEPFDYSPNRLIVKGIYPDKRERRLNYGPDYHSSAPKILTVDQGGRLSPHATGFASIRISFAGQHEYREVRVGEPGTGFIPPKEITDSLALTLGPEFHDKEASWEYPRARQLTIRNPHAEPVAGVCLLQLDGLDPSLEIAGREHSRVLRPLGQYYLELPDAHRNCLLPGKQQRDMVVRFREGPQSSQFRPRIYAGSTL